MHCLSVAVFVSLFAVLFSLRCHQLSASTSLDTPVNSVASECPANSLSCTKSVEVTLRTYTKGCSYTNCTSPLGMTNQPAQCFNISQINREAYNCCCYGDGCNAATSQSLNVVVGVSVLLLLAKLAHQ